MDNMQNGSSEDQWQKQNGVENVGLPNIVSSVVALSYCSLIVSLLRAGSHIWRLHAHTHTHESLVSMPKQEKKFTYGQQNNKSYEMTT